MAAIFAGCSSEKAYVFRQDFRTKKWDNVAEDNKTCRVHFLKKDGQYYFRAIPDDGRTPRFEYPLTPDNPVHNSGGGFLQVPLPERKELYGIKFKHHGDAESFFAKIVEELRIPPFRGGAMTLQPGVFPDNVATGGPSDFNLPAPIWPAVAPATYTPPASQPMAQKYVPPTAQPMQLPRETMVMGPQPGTQNYIPPTLQPIQLPMESMIPGLQSIPQSHPHPMQSTSNTLAGQPLRENMMHGPQAIPTQPQGQPMHGVAARQPYQPGPAQGRLPPISMAGNVQPFQQPLQQPYVRPNPVLRASQQNMAAQYPSQSVAAQRTLDPAPQMKQKPITPLHVTPLPQQPLPSRDVSSVASFLQNAINSGNIEAAKGMIDILAGLAPEKRKFTISFDESQEVVKEEEGFCLDIQIEFQSPLKRPLSVFLEDVKGSYPIWHLQLMIEEKFHIPRASQNWIIGTKLVKTKEDLEKPLEEYNITAEAKVFLYVMHTSKASVAREDFERVRRQQMQQQQAMQGHANKGGGEEEEHVYGHLGPRGFLQLQQQQQQQSHPAAQRQPSYQHIQPGPPPQHVQQGYPQQQSQGYPQQQPQGYPQQQPQGHPQQQPQGYPPQQSYHYQQQHGYQGGGGERYVDHVTHNPPAATTRGPPPQPAAQSRKILRAKGPDPPQRQPTNGLQFQQQAFVAYANQAQSLNPSQSPVGPTIQQHMRPPQQPPPPKLKKQESEEKVGWVCNACTFINFPRRPGCSQCGTARPEDYVIPPNCPMSEDEVRFLKQAQEEDRLFLEHQEREKERLKQEREENFRAMVQAEDRLDLIPNADTFECCICTLEFEPGEGVILRNCLHQFCKVCLRENVKASYDAEVKCPETGCNASIAEREIRAVVSEEELQEFYRKGLRQAEGAAPDSFHCRTPNCLGFCFYEDEVNEFDCPVCTKRNCLTCKAIHEGMNCQEYQDDLKRRATNDEAARATQQMLEELVKNGDAMHCPNCKIVVQKKGGCDWIMCSVCKTEICWATKGPRWGPKGRHDTNGGCRCGVGGKKCHPLCRNCH